MTNILLSVDFSRNGQKIALHVAKMAQQANARLILIYRYETERIISRSTRNEAWAQAQLDKLAYTLHLATGISITRLIKPTSGTDFNLMLFTTLKADIAILCTPTPDCCLVTRHEKIPILQVSSKHPFDAQVFQDCLTVKIRTAEADAPSGLLETI